MVDCITICNSACITCIWCILFSVCFPTFSKNLKKVDSSECCLRKKPEKHRKARLPKCVRDNTIYMHQRFRNSSCFEKFCNREYRERECRLCHRKKICVRPEKDQRIGYPCKEKDRQISQICDKLIQRSYNTSNDSLNKKDNTNTIKSQ